MDEISIREKLKIIKVKNIVTTKEMAIHLDKSIHSIYYLEKNIDDSPIIKLLQLLKYKGIDLNQFI